MSESDPSKSDEDENLHYVAEAEDLADGDRVVVVVQGREIGVFNIDGEYYAVGNFCVHQGGPVCEGRLSGSVTANEETGWEMVYERENEVLSCPWHGWEFSVKSGEHLARNQYRLPTYGIAERDGTIYIQG